MDCLPKKMAVIERWLLVEVRLYYYNVSGGTFSHQWCSDLGIYIKFKCICISTYL